MKKLTFAICAKTDVANTIGYSFTSAAVYFLKKKLEHYVERIVHEKANPDFRIEVQVLYVDNDDHDKGINLYYDIVSREGDILYAGRMDFKVFHTTQYETLDAAGVEEEMVSKIGKYCVVEKEPA